MSTKRFNVTSAGKQFADITRTVALKASVRALNRTIKSMRVEAKKEAAEHLGLKLTLKEVKRKFQLILATQAKPRATMILIDRGTPLIRFKPRSITIKTARGKRKGVTIEVEGKRELVPGGFRIKLKSGKKGIYKREGDSSLPIFQMLSTKLFEFFNRGDVIGRLRQFAQVTMQKNVTHEVNFMKGKEGTQDFLNFMKGLADGDDNQDADSGDK